MEYVEGATLAHTIDAGTLPTLEILRMGAEIADALDAAHAQGIVHRDVKPANVMLAAHGAVKVLDFGLARVRPAAGEAPAVGATEYGTVLGTIAYMSPEQAIGAAVDHRSDLFSLGVVLYEMVTGRLPFEGISDMHTVDLIRNVQPLSVRRFNESIPAELERIIGKCIEKSADRRYQSARELGIDLKALLRDSTTGAKPEAPMRAHNLPVQLTSFVGRRKELAELPRLVAASRLVTLTGAGGAGKTRLALRLASELVEGTRDGVWFADLSSLSDPSLVTQTIATAVGVSERAHRSLVDELIEHVRDRALLLVLDNCEHMIDACAAISETLLRVAPSLRIVATSREPLGVPGETVYLIPSLAVHEPSDAQRAGAVADSDAIRLFVERAAAVDQSFAPGTRDVETIARICRRLDGLPLAIELVAARAAVLSVAEIDARLADRFRLLTGGGRVAVARQRTLEAAVKWSYDLLAPEERALFARLSVFPGGWTLAAAECVCSGDGIETADVLDLMSRLVSKSLVVRESGGARHRYRYLETVRQYAREWLLDSGIANVLHDRHFDYFYREFRGATPILRRHGQLECLERLGLERNNVRAALEWGIESPALAERGLELAGALFWYWTKKGLLEEGRQWLERVLRGEGPAPLRARALIGLAHMSYLQGYYAESGAQAAEAVRLGKEAGDAWVVAFASFLQGLAAFERGNFDEAASFCAAVRQAADVCGQPIEHGGPLMVLGNIAVARGDLALAERLFGESIDVHRAEGDVWGLSILLSLGASLNVLLGSLELARGRAKVALAHCREIDDARGVAWAVEVYAAIAAAEGRSADAARGWGASDAMLERAGASLAPTISWIRERYLDAARASLGECAFERARTEGRSLSLAAVVAACEDAAC